jgi:ankyrin repeat protein
MECECHHFRASLDPGDIDDCHRFRWVVCQLDSLRKCLNLKKIRAELGSLPKTLDDTYDRVLSRIDDDGYSKEAFTILQWLCFSARPLGIKEIVEVLAIDLESCQFDPEQRFPEPRDIFRVCPSLVSVATASSRNVFGDYEEIEEIRLAHFSVKEYLTCSRIQQGIMSSYSILSIPSHTTIASGCLAYLLYFNGANVLTKDNVSTFPLAKYAAQYWTYHARIALDQDVESKELARLNTWCYSLLQTEDCFLGSIRLFDPDSPWKDADFGKSFEDLAPLLYYTSFFGLRSIIKSLLNADADVDAVGPKGMYGTALAAAAGRGYEKVVQQLLNAGADVDAVKQAERYGTALTAAAGGGHEKVVQQLLNAGADVNAIAPARIYGTALTAAAGGGHEKVVQQLLNAGADVNAVVSTGFYGTALAAAAGEGHEKVVQQLLNADADVNTIAPAQIYGTALTAAAGQGHKQIVQQFLNAGADVNAVTPEGIYGTALAEAAGQGHEKVVQQLLDAGADVNAVVSTGFYGTALAAAAGEGHEKVVQQLLDVGIDVNAVAPEGIYGTALAAAAGRGHEKVVQQLLDAGVDVNAVAPEGMYATALAAAAGECHEMIVQQLLDAGAIES